MAQFTPEELEEMKQLGINPDQATIVEQPQEDTALTPEEVEELKSMGVDHSKAKVVSQPPDTVVGEQPDADGALAPEAQTSKVGQFFSGLKTGAKETAAPFTVTEDEAQQERTMAELAGELVGSMGIDIAAGAAAAKAGAVAGSIAGPVGTAVGGLAGLAGYAVYSAYGQEELAQKRGGEFKAGRFAARTALAMNPLLRYGGKLSQQLTTSAPKVAKALQATEKTVPRIARYGAQVAGETAVAVDEFGAEHAKVATAVSLVLHGAMFARGRAIDPDSSRVIGDLSSDPEVIDAAGVAAEKVNKMDVKIPEKLGLNDLKFANFLVRKPGQDIRAPKRDIGPLTKKAQKAYDAKAKSSKLLLAKAQKQWDTLDDVKKMEAYKTHLMSDIMLEEIVKKNKNIQLDFARKGNVKDAPVEDLEALNKKIRDNQGVALEVDRLMGMGMTETLNRISEAVTMKEQFTFPVIKKARKAQKLMKRAKISKDQMGKLRAYFSEGKQKHHRKDIAHLLDDNDQFLSPKAGEAYNLMSSAWDDAYGIIKTMGFKPGYIEHYIPRKMLNVDEKASAVGDMARTLRTLADNMDPKVANKIHKWSGQDIMKANPDFIEEDAANILAQIRDLMKLKKKYGGDKSNKLDFVQLDELRKTILKTTNSRRMGNDVSAVFAREGDEVVESLRDYDIFKNLLYYMNTSVKSAILQDPMQEIYSYYRVFNKAGMKDSAQWVQDLMQDISGVIRPGTVDQMISDKSAMLKHHIDQGLKNAKQNKQFVKLMGYETLNLASEAFRGWQTAVYPAYLGLNVKAHIRDLTQNLLQTAPYLGGTYGYEAVAKSLAKNPLKHVKRLAQSGLLSKGAFEEAIVDRSSKVGRAFGRINNTTMKTYLAVEKANRIWSYSIGHTLAQDITKGNRRAIEAFGKMGAGVRASLRKRGITSLDEIKNNLDEVGDVFGRHLVARTQFHYGSEQKAQFLRSLGPLFSMFTKWPVSVGTDLSVIWREHPKKMDAAKRLFERYGVSLSGLFMAARLMDEDNEVTNYLIGNPTDWAPVMAVSDVSVLNNPGVEAVIASAETLREVVEDPSPEVVEKKLKAALRKIMKSGIPAGSSVINEIDRMRRAQGDETLSSELIGD